MSFKEQLYHTVRKLWPSVKKGLYVFFASSILSVIVFRFVPIPFTPLMLVRVVEQWSNGQPARLVKDWENLDHLSANIPLAVIASEDQKFTSHWGFDVEAIFKAYKNNQRKKKKTIRGASTITQQVAKNVFLWPGRSYLRKAFEVYFTMLIEVFWSKERIMEVYLNVAEMGDGYYGAEAASRKYFKCSASRLSKDQAAWLACILPNPRKYSPLNAGPYLQQRHAWIVRNMNNLGKVEF
ncbi:MAG TPA: monofunctional biosynthetic peptidoglycan transglycosylase [Cytophagaceae bacterium]|jgi:monofunctional biosynthetic peptidoglycan transglycosylase|nr:monofunctional biosynthetic peptidoglycan transglycosylase [Cytophagaceae bacterium]